MAVFWKYFALVYSSINSSLFQVSWFLASIYMKIKSRDNNYKQTSFNWLIACQQTEKGYFVGRIRLI